MPFKWVFFVILFWMVISFLGGAMDGTPYKGIDPDTGVVISSTGTLNTFMKPFTQSTTIPLVGNILAAVTTPEWWSAAANMFTFNFPTLFPGSAAFIRWGLLLCLGASFFITLTLATVRGTPSS